MILEFLKKFFFKGLLVPQVGGGLECFVVGENGWEVGDCEAWGGSTGFNYLALLIPEKYSLFKSLSFPLEHLESRDLQEAVELDVASWSPWADIDIYYWPQRLESTWGVSVWIWPKSYSTQLTSILDDVSVSHVIPELAWHLGAIKNDMKNSVYIGEAVGGEQMYAYMGSAGSVERSALCLTELDQVRFWNSLNKEVESIQIIAEEGLLESGEANVVSAIKSLGWNRALKHGKVKGVLDWAAIDRWYRPTTLVLVLITFWILSSIFVVWDKNQRLEKLIETNRKSATLVLNSKESVDRSNEIITALSSLRARQAEFEQALAALSQGLPRHAWLDAAQFSSEEGGWLDIEGGSSQSAELAALLEQLPEIEHAMFIGGIRRDQVTGLEPFKLRLKLKGVTDE